MVVRHVAAVRPNSPLSTLRSASPTKTAVLIDGSALFFATKALYPDRQLDYRAFISLIRENVPGLTPPSHNEHGDLWAMWTSAAPDNPGQTRFLDFAENELLFTVRRFSPAESYMIEPAGMLGLSSDSRAVSRLVRFDASIAFAIGRLAETHRFVVVSDSFALAEPLIRASRMASAGGRKNCIAFFGRSLDSRWQRILRNNDSVLLLDFDESESQLFGEKEVTKTALRDDFLLF